ncbi:MAG: 3'(2'),5'-bisphosphate nucleotidase [Phycisphaeraceae bacterium]|nr:3'(2'),5'-bisphosphate nucleotidase [Phycisphaeraceae bacterium]
MNHSPACDSSIEHGQALAAMCAAVSAAASVCSTVQAGLDRYRAITKDDRSPVTIADFASQAVVARALRAALGDDLVLVGEESSSFLRDPAHAAHLDAALDVLRAGAWPGVTAEALLDAIDLGAAEPPPTDAPAGFFTLDPIDGTKGFLRGGQYAVALAFIRAGRPELAAMGCPNLSPDPARGADAAPADAGTPGGCLFAAVRGSGRVVQSPLGASCGRGGGELLVTPASRAAFAGARAHPVLAESVESAHSDQSASAILMRELDAAYGLVRLDSQCKYAVVARGQADVYLRLPSKKGYVERIWDHAAGALIAEEAGCIVTDVDGRPLDFGHGRGLEANRGVVVATAALHARLIAAISAHRPPNA